MTDQSPEAGPAATDLPAPDAPPAAEAAPPPAAPLPLAAHLQALRNTLAWVVRDDGSHLWQARWIGATCVPRLERLRQAAGEDLQAPLDQALGLLEGVDERPWFERLGPVIGALEALGDAQDRVDPVAPALRPRALLVSGAAVSGGAQEPQPEPTPRRGEGRRRRQREAPAATEPRPRRRPSPPSLSPLEFGDPKDTGRALSVVPGASAALCEALAAQGIERLDTLLRTLPASAESLDLGVLDGDLPPDGTEVALRGMVMVRWRTLSPQGPRAHLHFGVGAHIVRCSWQGGHPHGVAYTCPEDDVVLAGVLRHSPEGLVLEDALPWKANRDGKVWRPRYGLDGVEDREIWALLHDVLGTSLPRLMDPVPRDLLGTARVPGLAEAYRSLHRPLGRQGRGRKRLVFDEFFRYRLAQSAEKVVRPKGLSHPLGHDLLSQLCVQHGIALDDHQEQAFDDIRRDLARPVAMVRLLQGDVGSGKALVALMAAVMVAESRSQVLFLAPDPLAAEHRYMFAEPLLRSVGLVPHLLGREPSKAQLDALRRGEAHIVFASRSLLERPDGLPEFKKLGLVVAEERQAFGTITQGDLAQGKHHPDLLVVTSVPIPSSLVFTLFATYDLTVLPPSPDSQVTTEVVAPDERQKAFEVIQDTVAAGQQAYLVFPLSRGADVVDRARGESLAAALAKEALDGARVALYHGTMSRDERFRVYEDFRQRRVDVLLATTSIEDAPEVSNATAMVVENADRFSLVRLHRLRGHVSQGRAAGRCVLVLSAEPDPAGQAIVDRVAAEPDGFAIAEQDRLARGDEALLGGRVQDLPTFELGDPVRDRDLFIRARRAAIQLLVKDPQLRQRAHRQLARQIPGLPDPGDRPPPREGGGEGGGRKRRRRRRRSGRR